MRCYKKEAQQKGGLSFYEVLKWGLLFNLYPVFDRSILVLMKVFFPFLTARMIF